MIFPVGEQDLFVQTVFYPNITFGHAQCSKFHFQHSGP